MLEVTEKPSNGHTPLRRRAEILVLKDLPAGCGIAGVCLNHKDKLYIVDSFGMVLNAPALFALCSVVLSCSARQPLRCSHKLRLLSATLHREETYYATLGISTCDARVNLVIHNDIG